LRSSVFKENDTEVIVDNCYLIMSRERFQANSSGTVSGGSAYIANHTQLRYLTLYCMG